MGRPGGGGGGRPSGGGHSSSRTGGGHHVGSSRPSGGSSFGRPSGGSSFGRSSGSHNSFNSFGRGPGMAPPPPYMHGGPGMPPPPRNHGGPGVPDRRGGAGCGTVIAVIIIILMLMFIIGCVGGCMSGDSQASTIQRTKLETGNAFDNNCIIDEMGWFDNASKAGSQLKAFWEETGVQPYIYIKAYDGSLMTDSQKEEWTKDYYSANIPIENGFLYVYFDTGDAYSDEVGYMTYANGYQTSSVMDSEAVEIFWNNIDKYWYSDYSTDDLFVKAFSDTGSTIMRVSTTGFDVMKWLIIAIIVIAICVFAIITINKRNQRAKEKAEEDQRILNTSMSDLVDDAEKYKRSESDDLADKYLGKKDEE